MKLLNFYKKNSGFTLIELIVAMGIISILSSVIYLSFDDARAQTRDKVRMVTLKEVQLALELYKSENGRYPTQGCGSGTEFAGPGPAVSGFASCDTYINNLIPDYLQELPEDPSREGENGVGIYYRTDTSGTAYKLMFRDSVEQLPISGVDDEFSRCPSTTCGSSANTNTYAVYSFGAETW